jgi:HEAT repeat protein
VSGETGFLKVLGELIDGIYGQEKLAAAFIDKDTYVREIGLEALQKLDTKRAMAMGIAALRDPDQDIQKAGGTALFALRNRPEALALLLNAAKDADAAVRREAILTIRDLDDPRVTEVLIQALNDSDKAVRIWAAGGLRNKHDRRATEPLLAALKERDPEIRREVARALGGYGLRAIEPLLATLKDKDSYVRYAAAESLKSITRQDFGEDVKRWQQWWKENKRTHEEADSLMQKMRERKP